MFKLLWKIIRWPLPLLLVLGAVAWFYPEKFLMIDTGPVTADVIIVVGGGSGAHDRAIRAAELYQKHAAPRVIITGEGDDQNNRRVLREHGVPDRVIEIEGKSTTTRENAEFTGKLLRAEKVRTAIVVTSWYHSRRATKTFAHYVPEVNFFSRPSYYDFQEDMWQKAGITKRMRLEFLKLPAYWVRYGVCPF